MVEVEEVRSSAMVKGQGVRTSLKHKEQGWVRHKLGWVMHRLDSVSRAPRG